ncbi:MAG: hypothetical protein ACE5HA_12400 [Anaerolineae bacterium]
MQRRLAANLYQNLLSITDSQIRLAGSVDDTEQVYTGRRAAPQMVA